VRPAFCEINEGVPFMSQRTAHSASQHSAIKEKLKQHLVQLYSELDLAVLVSSHSSEKSRNSSRYVSRARAPRGYIPDPATAPSRVAGTGENPRSSPQALQHSTATSNREPNALSYIGPITRRQDG
jgi:hypothetical protein